MANAKTMVRVLLSIPNQATNCNDSTVIVLLVH